MIAATLRFIPYVGVWTAALLPITLALAVFEGWREPLMVIALFVVVEPLVFLVIEPLVYGHRVGVSPFGLLIAVAFWTWLWGPVGLFLAVPLTVCLVVLGKYVPELSFLDVLIGEEPAVDPALACYQRLLAADHGEASDIMERHIDPHRPAAMYDEVLVPALAYAKRERAWDRISDDDRALVARGAREILASVAPPPAPPGPHAIPVVACPVHDELDELGFVMLHHLLDPADWAIELASAEMLSSEVVAFVADKAPAVVCLGLVGHGSVAHARYLVKRLRAAFPQSALVVARWGVVAFTAEEIDALQRAGATTVASTLSETRDHLRAAVAVERRSRAAA